MTANSARFVSAWIVAAVLLFRGGNAIRESFEARNWRSVPGIVTESDARWVEHHQPVHKSMWSYELHLRYAYTIGGREYVGTRASFSAWGPTENFNPFNSAIAHRYPVGAGVLAHCDPLDYSHSVLQPVARLSAKPFPPQLGMLVEAKLTKRSHDTALRDIQNLIRKGILKQEESGGRSTAYTLGREQTV